MEHGPHPIPVAKDFRTRLRGLAWCEREQVGPGLLIPRCASVHTFGMRFALDVYFLDRDGRVLCVHRRVPPRRQTTRRGGAPRRTLSTRPRSSRK